MVNDECLMINPYMVKINPPQEPARSHAGRRGARGVAILFYGRRGVAILFYGGQDDPIP